MSSVQTPANVPLSEATGKNTTVSVSVRMDAKLARLVRLAAVNRDTTRSAFMTEVAVQAARAVMALNREEDFRAWLDAAA